MLKSLKLKLFSKRGLLAIALAAVVAGAGFYQLQGAPSTTVFHECVERGKKEGMDAAITKNFCIHKYQGLIEVGATKGNAGPTHCKDDKTNETCDEYEFKIKNVSKEYVVTLIEFTVENRQTQSSENHVFEGQWIEPSKEQSFEVKLSNPFSLASDSKNWKDQHKWRTMTIKGFKMNY